MSLGQVRLQLQRSLYCCVSQRELGGAGIVKAIEEIVRFFGGTISQRELWIKPDGLI